MKISIILLDGAKQIMMTPETDHEKKALEMIGPEDELKVVSKWGTLHDGRERMNYQINKCRGGYYRAFEDRESLMFVIEDESLPK